MSDDATTETLARMEVAAIQQLADIRALQAEHSHPIVTHDGSVRTPDAAHTACVDDEPPSRPVA